MCVGRLRRAVALPPEERVPSGDVALARRWVPEVLLRVVGGREKLPCLALVWVGELEFCGADAAWAQ